MAANTRVVNVLPATIFSKLDIETKKTLALLHVMDAKIYFVLCFSQRG